MKSIRKLVSLMLVVVMCLSVIGYGSSMWGTSAYGTESEEIVEDTLNTEESENTENAEDTENDKEGVTVYFTLSDDGRFVTGNDANQTLMCHVPVTVEYFDLAEYGLEDYYRYESEAPEEGGEYIGSEVLEKPTLLHLYIRVLEEYYLGGEKLEIGGEAFDPIGSATSMYMKHFWGHDENLMYFVNHAYPLMRAGWGATADYILLEEGMDVDIAMFTDWNFYTHGAFAYFSPTSTTVGVDEEFTMTMKGAATHAPSSGEVAEDIPMADEAIVYAKAEDVGSGFNNEFWDELDVRTDENGQVTLSFSEPGTYYISSSPYYETFYGDNGAECVAPPIATIVVEGDGGENEGGNENLDGTEDITVLSNLRFSANNTATSKIYSMTPEFDSETEEYTVYVGDNEKTVSLWGFATEEAASTEVDSVISVEYTDIKGNQVVLEKETDATAGLNLSNIIDKGGKGAQLTVNAACGLSTQTYTVNIVRIPSLKQMSCLSDKGSEISISPEFNGSQTEYTVIVPADVESVSFDAIPLSDEYSVFFNGETPSENGAFVVDTSTRDDKELLIGVKNNEGYETVYQIHIDKKGKMACTFENLVEGTIINIKNSKGKTVFAGKATEDSVLFEGLQQDEEYTYTLTLKGYKGLKGKFTAEQEMHTFDGALQEAEVNSSIDSSIESLWPDFRGNSYNNAITEAVTPTEADDAQLYWATKSGGAWAGAPSCPIFVEDYLVFTTNTQIVKVDKISGKTVQTGEMVSKAAFSIVPPTYANGMIFVSLAGGRVQAFNAETLESLWVYTDELGGQPNSPITYADGYVYTGFWNSEIRDASYVCLTATDEDITNTVEDKYATWTQVHKGGFYWAGSVDAGNAIIVGSENGSDEENKATGVLYSFDKETGTVLDKIDNIKGDIRSTVVYDKDSDRFCFTSRGGNFYVIKLNEDGTFNRDTLQIIELGGQSSCTPVVNGARAYVGIAGSSNLGAYSGHGIAVIDLDSGSIAYTVETRGYPQTSGLLTNAYYDEEGYTYVYFIENYTPGIVRVLKDKKGMTEPELNDKNDGILQERLTYPNVADTLFTPRGEQAEFAIGSPIVDEYGTIYFKNDSTNILAVGSKIESIEVIQAPDKIRYDEGEIFDPTGMVVVAHLANGMTRDITDYVTYTTEPLTSKDLEVEIKYEYVMYNDAEKKCDIPKTYISISNISAEQAAEVKKVDKLISAIKNAKDKEAAVAEAREAFDKLTIEQQGYVENEYILISYETEFAEEKMASEGEKMKVSVTATDYNKLTVKWSKCPSADGYEIYRSTEEGQLGTKLKDATDVNSTSLVNTVTCGVQYYYTVRPYILVDKEPCGETYSKAVSGMTSLTAPEVSGKSTSYNRITLSWKEVPGANGYKVYRYDKKLKDFTLIKTLSRSTDTSFADKDLDFNKTYKYKVTTWRANAESGFSNEISVKTVLPAPTNLEAKRASYSSINLTWEKVTGAKGYTIYRATSKDGTYKAVKKIEGAETLSFKDKSLETGKTYYYKVKAYRGEVEGKYSSYSSAKTYLSKVTGVEAAKSSYNSIKITWKKVTGAEGYKVYRATSANGTYKAVKTVKGIDTLSWKNEGLVTGKTYYYKVTAFRDKSESSMSTKVSAKTYLSKVTGVDAQKSSYNSIKVTWKKVTGAEGYKVYRATSAKGTYKVVKTVKGANNLSWKNEGLETGKIYYYKVKAYRGESESGFSSYVSAKPTLSKVTELKLSAGKKKANLEWKKVSGANGYIIYRATSKDGTYKKVNTVAGGAKVKYTDKNLTSGKAYYYRVKAYRTVNDEKVYGGYSSKIKVVVK